MKNSVVNVLLMASVLTPVAAFAQAAKAPPATATYIMKDEIDKVGATEQSASTRDENIKIVDLGYENFAVGMHFAMQDRPETSFRASRRDASVMP
jgi:hypothetical protein